MSIPLRILFAIPSLFISNAILAVDETSYLALTNDGYVDVSLTLENRTRTDTGQGEIYRDLLISETAGDVDASSFGSSNTAEDE